MQETSIEPGSLELVTDGRISRTPKGRRPQYFADPATDKLMAMVVTLASELSVTRDRLDAVERLLDQGGMLKQAQVDDYTADGEASDARQAQRQRLIDRLLRLVDAELEEAEADVPRSREALLKALEDE